MMPGTEVFNKCCLFGGRKFHFSFPSYTLMAHPEQLILIWLTLNALISITTSALLTTTAHSDSSALEHRSRQYFMVINSFNSHNNPLFLPLVLEMQKLRHREIICLRLYCQKWQNQDLNPGSLTPMFPLLIIQVYCFKRVYYMTNIQLYAQKIKIIILGTHNLLCQDTKGSKTLPDESQFFQFLVL